MKNFAFAMLAATLVGCSAQGIRFDSDQSASLPPSSNKARVVVFRSFDFGQYRLRSASIEIDGQSAQSCKYGGYSIFDLKAGEHAIRADMWDMPGSCKLQFSVKEGESAYFEVKPITSSLFFGGVISGSIRAAIVECAGGFSIENVTAEYALTKLSNLRRNSDTD